MTPRGLQEISLDAIVGSVGRYTDFNRQFLPRQRGDESRWARVRAAMQEGRELPPIDVYQIGQIYTASVAQPCGRCSGRLCQPRSRIVVRAMPVACTATARSSTPRSSVGVWLAGKTVAG